MNGNNGICLPDRRKGRQKPGKIENVKEKIQSEEDAFSWSRKILFGPGAVDKKRFVAAARYQWKKERAEKKMRLLRAFGPRELEKYPLALLRKVFEWETEK